MEAAVELGAAESGVRPACSSTEGACQRGRGWPSARHHNAPRAGIPAERFVLRLPSSSGDLHRVGGGQSEASGSPWRVQAGHCPRALPSSPSPGHLHPRRHRFSQARHPGAMETLSPGQPERPCGLQPHVDPRFPGTMSALRQKPHLCFLDSTRFSLPAHLPQSQRTGTTRALVTMGPQESSDRLPSSAAWVAS